MRTVLISTVLAFSLTLLVAPRRSEACSPVNDTASPPDVELAYDATNSPSAPAIVEAEVSHYHESSACNNGGSCGDLHSLALTLNVDPTTTLLRIDFVDQPTVYANVWDGSSGTARVIIPGYENVATLDMTIRAIDDRGYLSEPVTELVRNEKDNGGCSASGSQSSALLVLGAILLVLFRRRTTCRP